MQNVTFQALAGRGSFRPIDQLKRITTMRCLAPAGGFPNPAIAGTLISNMNPARALKDQLRVYTGQSLVSICSSGKQAIEKLVRHFSGQGYTRVVTAGYGCPDIVAAALRGGAEVYLADIDPNSLEPRFDNLDSKKDIIILSNLYGLVDPIEGLQDFRIIDDGCQAALSSDENGPVGSRGYGVLSFGRGKAICGVGGGAVVGLEENEIISEKKFSPLIKNFLFNVLERPHFYSLPASLPFLKLGETHFEPDYADSEMTFGHCLVALESIKNFEIERNTRLLIQNIWLERVSGLDLVLPYKERSADSKTILTRFPVLFPEENSGNRDKAYYELRQAGLGASLSYPASLGSLCRSCDKVSEIKNNSATKVAECILTLPTHRYVKQSDVDAAVLILKKYA